MSGVVKIFTFKHSTMGHEQDGEKKRCGVPPSISPLFLSLSHCFLHPCFPSNKVGQHHTSELHAGGKEGEGLSLDRSRWADERKRRKTAK